MKERKNIRDGIAFYSPKGPKLYTTKREPHPFLLAAVQLLAVWFLAFSWWQSLTSAFPMDADAPRLYLFCFLFTAILTVLWNSPLRRLWKCSILLLLFCLAGAWIWRHLEAAMNVINLTANAYLAVRRPDADPYPIQPIPDPEMAFMFALFLLPLLLIWSLILHLRKGKIFAYLLLLAPAAWILAETLVPSELSCWLVLLSGGIYGSVCGCREGRGALFKGLSSACILALLILLSSFTSRPLEDYKEPSDGLYARTRETIETEWIKPLQDSYNQAKAEREEKKQLAWETSSKQEQNQEKNPGQNPGQNPEQEPEQPDADETQPDSGEAQPDPAFPQPEPEPAAPDLTPETDIQPDFAAGPSADSASGNDSQSSAENDAGNLPDVFFNNKNGSYPASADRFPNLNNLSHFQPDTGSRLTLTLDYRPEETVYHPSAYGVFYMDSHWYDLPSGCELSPEDYLSYPDELRRLKKLCQQHAPTTLEKTSDFIQREFVEYTVYDFEPGPTPSGKDFAEYFLFDNQKGFCVHFATAAVLMYRICGYPARYVQGYAVPVSAFHRQEDGSYAAEVTGEMGHAWCQVLENGEWITKEHTLPYHGVRPEPGIPAVSSSRHAWVRNAAGWRLLFLKACAVGILCLTAAALLLFTQAALRRQRRYQKFRSTRRGAGIRRIYRALYDTAVFQGMEKIDILSFQGSRRLRDSLPLIATEDMEWLYQAVLETMFYQRTVTKEETRHAWKIYQQFSHAYKRELTISKKFIYSYIKAM